MTNDTFPETHTGATASQIADLLDLTVHSFDWDSSTGTITLNNAQARRLLALAAKATEQPYLALTEEDAVEVFHALDKTAQAYCTFGDKVTSAHFADLYGRLVNAPKGV